MDNALDIPIGEILKTQKSKALPNLAKMKTLRERFEKLVQLRYSEVEHGRSQIDVIRKTADKMMRQKVLDDAKTENRANTANGLYSTAVHQLEALTLKAILGRLKDYRYMPVGLSSEPDYRARAIQADAWTAMFHTSINRPESLRALSKLVHWFWKYGNCLGAVEWIERQTDYSTWKGSTFEPEEEYIGPVLAAKSLSATWLDVDIEDLNMQSAIFLEGDMSWTELVSSDFVLPEDHTRQAMQRYAVDKAAPSKTARTTAQETAGVAGDAYIPEPSRYSVWAGWVKSPVQYSNKGAAARWDDDGPEYWHRLRILGNPASGHILEAVPNPFPLGLSFLPAHQSEDDVGFHHQAPSELVKTYYEQVCTAQNQLIDNRDKNNRTPLVYNSLNIPLMEVFDYGAAEAIPTDGDPNKDVKQLDVKDMTGTNLAHIEYCKKEGREALHATRTVMGEPMGGRTPATEYLGASKQSGAPIWMAITRFEQAIMVPFMQKFRAYVAELMTAAEFVSMVGRSGLVIASDEVNKTLIVKMRIQAAGVANFSTEAERHQKASNLYQMTGQDQMVNRGELLTEVYESAGYDAARFVKPPMQSASYKEALLENAVMVEIGEFVDVSPEDDHAIHPAVHERALLEVQLSDDIPGDRQTILQAHINKHHQCESQAMSGVAGSQFPTLLGPDAAATPTPGDLAGQDLSARLGNVQGGSSIPQTA